MVNTFHKFVLLSIIIFYTSIFQLIAQNAYEIDKRIVLKKGLSQSRIQAIIEDERGFMWFGTADGLNRYDGYKFKIFRKVYNDSTSLPNNNINSMVEDGDGNIWIGTNDGIAIFNPYLETFTVLKETDSAKISNGINIIKACAIDLDNNIWVGTAGAGVYRINPKTYERKRLHSNESDSLKLNNTIRLYVDKKNRLWFGNFIEKEIFTYDITNDSFERYSLNLLEGNHIKRFKTTAFFEDSSERLWISVLDYNGTGGSLYFISKDSKIIEDYEQFNSKFFMDRNFDRMNSIVSITSDDNGKIWFASLLGGIFSFDFGQTPTVFYSKSHQLDARINCLYRSANGILWIGTNGNGVEMSIPNNTDFKLMNNEINNNFSIKSIRAFAEDKEYYWVGGYYGLAKIKKDFSEVNTIDLASVYSIGIGLKGESRIWTGSEGGGVQPVNTNTDSFFEIKTKVGHTVNQIPRNIFVIHPLSDTMLLLGSGVGLVGYNPVSGKVTEYPTFCASRHRKVPKSVRTIYEDKLGNILIGFVQGGIGRLDLNDRKIKKFKLTTSLHNENDYNPINCIYEDNQDRYWVATNNGLFMIDGRTNKSTFITEKDGLPNNHVYGILPDEEGNLWLSTNNGISCYSPDNKTFKNYDNTDGLQNNEFNTGAYFLAKDSTMFFGGVDGFNYFNPKQIKQNNITPKIVITDIKISNKSIRFSKQETISKELIVKSDDDLFSIEFAGLSFINCSSNKYKYRLKELNSKWVSIGTHHKITFNSLDPGTHTLEILASNNHGLWLKKPFQFTIIRKPTFLQSLIFKILIAILVIVILVIAYTIRVKSITKQKESLQKIVNERTLALQNTNDTLKKEIAKHKKTTEKLKKSTKELKASNITKDKFLSIMAHDIINPLNVILGFSDLVVKDPDDFDNEDRLTFIQTINQTAKGLNSLISNLLQWSRLQNGTIYPKRKKIVVETVIAETVSLLQGNLSEKEIFLQTNISPNSCVFADRDMLLTIMRNLLSNAIKFTPAKGSISINTMSINNTIEISIIDTGVGISKKNIVRLFNSNDNLTTKGTSNESGTGLGLGLVYEFVIMNGGKIWVEAEEGRGSEFSFSLPTC